MLKDKLICGLTVAAASLAGSVFLAGNVFAVDLVGFHEGGAPDRSQIDLVRRSRLLSRADANFADNFSEGSLDRSRYNTPERIREIDTSQGMLRVFTGANNSSAGVNFTRTNNWILNSENHSSVEADIIITDVEFGSQNHPAFANVGGTFYSNSATSNGSLGHVFAQLKVGYRGNGLEAWAHIGTSLDSGFNTEEVNASETIVDPGVISQGDTVTARLEYNGGNSFTFEAVVSFASGGSSSFSRTISGPTRVSSASSRKRVGTGIDWEDSGGVVDPTRVSIDALFDNVKTNGFTRDSFNNDFINTNTWLNAEEYRVVEMVEGNSAVRMEAVSQNAQRDVNLEVRDNTDYIEADIMLDGRSDIPSGVRGLVRLQGHFYNDTFSSNFNGNEGDVYAHVILDRQSDGNLVAKAYAERSDNSAFTQTTTLFSQAFSSSVDFNMFYPASIEFTGSSIIFTFNGEQKQMAVDTATNPAFFPTKMVRTRVTGGAGRTIAFVDNLRTSKSASFPSDPDDNGSGGDSGSGDGSGDSSGDSSGGGGGGATAVYLLMAMLGAAWIRRRKW